MEPSETTTKPEYKGETIPDSVEVWVCPNCGDWSGSATMPDLGLTSNVRTSMQNKHDEDPDNWGKEIGSRSTCQRCCQDGNGDHQRVRIVYYSRDAIRRATDRVIADTTEPSRAVPRSVL